MLIASGAQIDCFPEAVARQHASDKKHQALSKSFTTQISLGCNFSQQWGVTSLTWDPQYSSFVSPHTEDTHLGGQDFDTHLSQVAQGSLIHLDPFSPAQQTAILDQLAADDTGRWMLLVNHMECTDTIRHKLDAVGFQFDSLLSSHRVAAPALGWRSADVTPTALESRMQVWMPEHCHIPMEIWNEWVVPRPLPGSLHPSLSPTQQTSTGCIARMETVCVHLVP